MTGPACTATLDRWPMKPAALTPRENRMLWWHDSTWMWIVMVGFWGFVALGVLIAARGWTRPRSARTETRAASVLDERYAQGEISAEEYHERCRILDRAPADRTDGASLA